MAQKKKPTPKPSTKKSSKETKRRPKAPPREDIQQIRAAAKARQVDYRTVIKYIDGGLVRGEAGMRAVLAAGDLKQAKKAKAPARKARLS
jgi:hypothetical protein